MGWREIPLKEFSAPQPLTKPKMVGSFAVYDANFWQDPRRAAPLGTPWVPLSASPRKAGKGSWETWQPALAGPTHHTEQLLFGTVWGAVCSSKVKCRVGTVRPALNGSAMSPWSIWPGLGLPEQLRLVRDTRFSEARAWVRADNLCPRRLTKLLSKKKFIFCVKAIFQKRSHIVRSCHLQPCIFPIHLPALPNPVSGTFSTQMIYTLPNEQNLQIHPPVWVPGSSKAKASFRVLHSSYISVFTSSKK